MGRPVVARLSIERIVDEALALIDSGDAFSMRALGKRLDVAAPSLYYHVSGLDRLIDLIRDRMVEEFPPPPADESRPWREEIEAILRAMRAGYAAHPRLVTLLVGTPITSASVLAVYERMAGALRRAGFPPATVSVYLETLDSFALGIALERGAPAEVWRTTDGALAEASRAWPDAEERLDAAFDVGIQALLGAIERAARG
ncbi:MULTISPECIES: TetR/AcrR family transcriptional regulator C-terminal domain-containing protein [unclassified Microbacterium]|uniref:TetR/AcrR family transcriptional regulator C-terminal domain-containing protein n=1 Tax=unclassified Microbacterium TaxID=2609290 RepID=UPI0030175163